MTPAISVRGLTRRYHDHLALDDVGFEVEAGSITGLFGRNGAGKTTLLRILAGQEFPSAGSVRVLGANPVENDDVLRRMVLVREDQVFPPLRVRQVLQGASLFYPNWSAELARTLVADLELPLNRMVQGLSRGARSRLGIILGLAARADVTLIDEPYAGLDSDGRRMFCDRLLADYADHPRTVLLSTHLIDETAGVLERVLALERGRVVLDAATDDLRGAVTVVSGPAPSVEEFVAGRRTADHRRMASRASAVVVGALDVADCVRARELHLQLESLSLQQAVIYAAGSPETDPQEARSV